MGEVPRPGKPECWSGFPFFIVRELEGGRKAEVDSVGGDWCLSKLPMLNSAFISTCFVHGVIGSPMFLPGWRPFSMSVESADNPALKATTATPKDLNSMMNWMELKSLRIWDIV